jgi:hypothetical protein
LVEIVLRIANHQVGLHGAYIPVAQIVLRLCEEADFGAENCNRSTKVDAR